MKNKKLFASIMAGILAAAMLLGLLASILPTQAAAATSSELKNQLNELEDEKDAIDQQLAGLRDQLNDNSKEIEAIVAKKNIIDQEIFLLNEKLSIINDQFATTNLLIADKQDELDAAQERLDTLNEQNKDRIRAMEEGGTLSYWSVLFKASSFSDLLDRLNMIEEIAAADQRRLESLQEAADAVTAAQEELVLRKEELEVSKAELDASQAELDGKRKEADELLSELIAAGEEYEAMIDESEALQEQLLEDIAKTEKEYDAAKYQEWLATSVPPTTTKPAPTTRPGGDSSAPPVSSSGWRSPLVKSSYVTSPYGMRLHPVYGTWKMHHGVDLKSSLGDTIVAARSGVVTRATYQEGGGGYYVTINHGDGFSSSYLHMTHYIVSEGDYVSAGQTIGYVGSTGVSTGPHLHFSIYYNGSSVNPVNYVNF